MREALEKLIELQNVDSKLIEIEELRGSLPNEVEQLKKDLGGTQESLAESGTRIGEIDSQIRDIEGNIAQANQKLKKYKEQLYAVNTNKEYDALTHELEAMQSAIRESENQIFDLMVEKEENEELNKNSKALFNFHLQVVFSHDVWFVSRFNTIRYEYWVFIARTIWFKTSHYFQELFIDIFKFYNSFNTDCWGHHFFG